MKLLLITQKVDKDDDTLGVYHRWIEKLAEKTSHIIVICLYRGRVELPENVRVVSLGKEDGRSRIKYIIRLYRYLREYDKNYDTVFVHMNSEYVVLAGWWWRFKKRKIVFWYNHFFGDLKARVAFFFANTILHTSPFAFSANRKKSKVMPVGIDTNYLVSDPNIKREKNSFLYLGRISPIKNIDVLIKAAKILKSKKKKFKLTIVGGPTEGKKIEYDYWQKIEAEGRSLSDKIKFVGPIPYTETLFFYNSHETFVNLTNSGSFDKTTLEAASCESLVLVSNTTFESEFTASLQQKLMFKEKDYYNLAKKMEELIDMNDLEKNDTGKELREYVIKNHSLNKLTTELLDVLK